MNADIVVKSIIYSKENKKILLIRRSKDDSIGAGTWENAGGNVEYGETPKQALVREIREETGICDVRIDGIAYVTLVYGAKPYLIIAYLCEALTEAVELSNEHQSFVWANEEQCRNYLPKAIIDDFDENNIFDRIGMC